MSSGKQEKFYFASQKPSQKMFLIKRASVSSKMKWAQFSTRILEVSREKQTLEPQISI